MRLLTVYPLYCFLIGFWLPLQVAKAQVPETLVLGKFVADTEKGQARYAPNRTLVKAGIRFEQEALIQDSLVLEFSSLRQLGRLLKKSRFGIALAVPNLTKPNRTQALVRHKRKALYEQLHRQWERLITTRLPDKARQPNWEAFKAKEWRAFRKLLRGKNPIPDVYAEVTWQVYLGSADLLQSEPARTAWRVEFLRGKKWYGLLYADTLRTALMPLLPNYTQSDCVPTDRYALTWNLSRIALKSLDYEPFNPVSEIKRMRTFTLRFAKNEAGYRQEEVDQLKQFLQDSNYVLHKAQITGFASVEGDTLNNQRLMEARAEILRQALQEANQGDTVTLALETFENWALFARQQRKQGLDTTRTKAEWKALLRNDSIAAALEPLLASQRLARIKLYLSIRLQQQEKIEVALGLYNKFIYRYQRAANDQNRLKTVRKVMAIRSWLSREVAAGRLEPAILCRLDPLPDNIWSIFQLYEAARLLDEGIGPFCRPVEEWLLEAHERTLWLMESYPQAEVYPAHLRSIQAIAYDLIAKGQVPAELLCQLRYPDAPRFYGFILSQLDFQSRIAPALYLHNPCRQYMGQLGPGSPASWQASAGHYEEQDSITADALHSPYYFLIKKRALQGEDLFAQYSNRPEGQLLAFDLYTFLHYNITGWEPAGGSLFDAEVTPAMLNEQLRRLLKNPGPLCPRQLDALALEFHRKVLYHCLYEQWVDELGHQSIKSLSAYYRQHATEVPADELQLIAQQLLAVNSFCFKQEAAIATQNLLGEYLNKQPQAASLRKLYCNLLLLLSPRAGWTLRRFSQYYQDPIASWGQGVGNLPLQLLPAQEQQLYGQGQ